MIIYRNAGLAGSLALALGACAPIAQPVANVAPAPQPGPTPPIIIADTPIPNPPIHRRKRIAPPHVTPAPVVSVNVEPLPAPANEPSVPLSVVSPSPVVTPPASVPVVAAPAHPAPITDTPGAGLLGWLAVGAVVLFVMIGIFGRRACNAWALMAASENGWRMKSARRHAARSHETIWHDDAPIDSFDASALAKTMSTFDPVTAEAIVALWRRDLIDRGVDLSLIEVLAIDPRTGDPLVGEIIELDHVHIQQRPRRAAKRHHDREAA